EEVFTTEGYHQEIKPRLMQGYIRFVQTHPENIVGKFLKGAQHLKLVEEYLLNKSEVGSQFVENIQDKHLKDLLAIVKEELNVTIPLTLSKRCDERYGFSLSPDEHLAIPFVANNIPSQTSRFKNPNTILNYTTQTYLIKGIPPFILKNIIER